MSYLADKVYLTEDQFRKLAETPLSRHAGIWSYISFVFYGNMHSGDVESLKFEMIDFESGTINIPSDFLSGSALTIPITKELHKIIESLNPANEEAKHFVFGENFEPCAKPIQLNESKALNKKVMKIIHSMGGHSLIKSDSRF